MEDKEKSAQLAILLNSLGEDMLKGNQNKKETKQLKIWMWSLLVFFVLFYSFLIIFG